MQRLAADFANSIIGEQQQSVSLRINELISSTIMEDSTEHSTRHHPDSIWLTAPIEEPELLKLCKAMDLAG